MNKKFTITKLDSVWKCNYEKHGWGGDNEWLFQTLEELCIFMEDYLDSLEEIQSNMFTFNHNININ